MMCIYCKNEIRMWSYWVGKSGSQLPQAATSAQAKTDAVMQNIIYNIHDSYNIWFLLKLERWRTTVISGL